MKRTFSFLLALLMLCTLLPVSALAADPPAFTLTITGMPGYTDPIPAKFVFDKTELGVADSEATTTFTITPKFDGQSFKLAAVNSATPDATPVEKVYLSGIEKDVSEAVFTPATFSVIVDWTAGTVTADADAMTITNVKDFPVLYTVTFDANGGSVATTSKKVEYGKPYGELPTPTYADHIFDGWYNLEDSTKVSSTSNVTTEKDHTLQAKWLDAVTVTFDANGGSVNSTGVTIPANTAVGTLPTPTRDGYTFNGWFSAATGGDKVESTTTFASSASIYAQWTQKSYKVTFVVPGLADTYETVLHGNNATLPSVPAKTGYTAAWDKDGKNITADTTITAAYTPNTYKITYMDGTTALTPGTYTYDTGVAEGSLYVPVKTGYTFKGWYAEKELTNQVKSIAKDATGDVTLYAKWEANKYTVKFDVNGGKTPAPADITVTYGAKYGTLPTASHATLYFAGWYTQASGGTRIYTTSTVTSAGTQVLYAHWSTVPVTGDDVSPAEIALLSGALLLSLAGIVGVVIYKKKKG